MKNLGKSLLIGTLPLWCQSPLTHLSVDKTTLFAGETVKGEFFYAIPKEGGAPQVSSTLSWDHPFLSLQRKDDANETHYFGTRTFLFTPQKGGKFLLNPSLDVGLSQQQDQSYQRYKDISAFDNTHPYVLKPSPVALSVKNQGDNFTPFVGTFKVTTTVSKTTLKPREPLYYTLTIEGEGSIDAFSPPTFKIQGVHTVGSVTENTTHYTTQRGGKVVFSYTMIGEQDFTIPPLTWETFHPRTQQKTTLSTQPYKVHVAHPTTATPPLISTQEVSPQQLFNNLLYFLFGVGATLLSLKLLPFVKKREKKEQTFEEKVLEAKEDKMLLALLLPYASSPEMKDTIHLLETNLYTDQPKQKIERKMVLEKLKKMKEVSPLWEDEKED